MASRTGGIMRLADQPTDYVRFGVDPQTIAQWEDGQRAAADAGSFEWWYADAFMETKDRVQIQLVVVFFTKPVEGTAGGLQPQVFLSVIVQGAPPLRLKKSFAATDLRTTPGTCQIDIGGNVFSGSLDRYRIEVRIGDAAVSMDLTRTGPSLRRGTGHLLFEQAGREEHFAWLPAVPLGQATARIEIGGSTYEAQGIGYHDHNWGNADPSTLMHDWYWGRAYAANGYAVIAAHITPQAAFQPAGHTVFLLLQHGHLISGVDAKVEFTEALSMQDDCTGKPHARLLRFTWTDGATQFVAEFGHAATVLRKFLDGSDECDPANRPPNPERLAAYHRFVGPFKLRKSKDGQEVETSVGKAMWERMFFGPDADPRALSNFIDSRAQLAGRDAAERGLFTWQI